MTLANRNLTGSIRGWLKRPLFLLFCCPAAFCNAVISYGQQKETMLFGIGRQTCGEFIQGDEPYKSQVMIWTLGYVSAHNLYNNRQYRHEKFEVLQTLLQSACRDNPEKAIITAVIEILNNKSTPDN